MVAQGASPDVERDMARVFSALSGVDRPAAAEGILQPPRPLARKRVKVDLVRALLVVAAIACGILAIVVLRPADRAATSPQGVDLTTKPPAMAPAPALPPATISIPSREPMPAPVPRSTSSPAIAAPPLAASTTATRKTSDPAQAEARTVSPLATTRRRGRTGETQNLPTAPERPGLSRVASLCRDARSPNACLDGEVRNAETRLRQAYDRALNSPLTVSELAKVRQAWSRALTSAPGAPRETITNLDRLTTRLYNDIQAAGSERPDA